MASLKDRTEEILETLWVETVENKNDGCRADAIEDGEAVRELADSGFVETSRGSVRLTEKGRKEAKSCVRRHRLAERLLADVLDFRDKSLHEKSCRFEHLLHDGLEESICTLLGHPPVCPHGRPIPEGDCCREAKATLGRLIMPLRDLTVGDRATVSYLQTGDRDILQKLLAMGVLPNAEVVLEQKSPSYVFQVGKSRFAIDEELASHIFVRRVGWRRERAGGARGRRRFWRSWWDGGSKRCRRKGGS